MGLYADRVLPHILDRTGALPEVDSLRSEVARGLSGEVVEIGFGSGLNLPHLPDAVSRLLAVDPSRGAHRLAESRIAESPVPVERVGLDGEDLPLEDASVDHALCTFTLCTVPHPLLALHELHRVLRPGGRLHMIEHGLHPDPGVARWQHRLTPLQRRAFGGCHLDRPIDELVHAGGFGPVEVRHVQLAGPKVLGAITLGVFERLDPAPPPHTAPQATGG